MKGMPTRIVVWIEGEDNEDIEDASYVVDYVGVESEVSVRFVTEPDGTVRNISEEIYKSEEAA
jgi:hypothetical protein